MELTAGYPFWLINDGLLHHYPKLVQNAHTHVTVIGGGISGALAAYHFTEAGIACILVDSRSIGLGSTCASTSLLQYELDIPLHQLKKKVGKEVAERSYQLCGEAINKLIAIMEKTGYPEYEHNPSLLFSTHHREKNFMNEEYAARKDAGFETVMLTAGEMMNLFGLRAAYGILSKTGATINTYSLTHHLLQYAMQKGLQVYDRTTITSIEDKNDTVQLTTKEGYVIQSAYAVNATGYEVIHFIDKDIVNFDCTYAIISEHQSEKEQLWKDRAMLWNTDHPYLYMRLTTDNRLIAGGRDEAFSNKVTRQLFLDKKAALLEKDVKKVLPGIEFKKEFAWSGTFGKTKDSLPYIGAYHKTPRVFYALGFGGNGITFSQVAAEMICDLLQSKKNPDISLFSFTR
jgi:glycine/D-amino acid oxidase-like deaminating enzyme